MIMPAARLCVEIGPSVRIRHFVLRTAYRRGLREVLRAIQVASRLGSPTNWRLHFRTMVMRSSCEGRGGVLLVLWLREGLLLLLLEHSLSSLLIHSCALLSTLERLTQHDPITHTSLVMAFLGRTTSGQHACG